jgi:hypothetical protein
VSTIFTLFLTPTLMSLALDMQAAVMRLFAGGDSPIPPGAKGDGAPAGGLSSAQRQSA